MHVVFRALGPVGVECGGTALALRPMEQNLLAVLLARSRHWASTDDLLDTLWPGQPARNATNSLRVHAHRLRGQFREVGRHRLVTEDAGYRLVVEQGELDLATFESAERRARAAWPGDAAYAVGVLREALDLWRGEPFADIEATFARDAARRLTVVREGIVTTLAEIELAQGNHRAIRTETDDWALEFPWSEQLARAQVLAHYRCGGVEGATRRHGAFTRRLRTELGVEASADFRRLLVDILNQAPHLAAPDPGVATPRAPRRAPPGRATQAGAVAADAGERRGIVAVVAPGGFGKSTLLAHLVETRPGWHATRQLPTLDWYERLLVTATAVSPKPVIGQSVHLRLAHAVFGACQDQNVAVLAVDDADVMGPDAIKVLAAFAGMPQRPGLVLTSRSREGLDAIVRCGLDIDAVVGLPALPDDDARTAVRDLLPEGVADDVIEAIVARSEGHPLLLTALSRHIAAGGAPEAVPESVTTYVRSLLQSLSAGQRRLATLAALDNSPVVDPVALVALVERPNDDVLNDLEALVAAGLLCDAAGEISFRHKVFQDATRKALSPVRRRAAHADFARWLEPQTLPGADLAQLRRLIHHLTLSGDEGLAATSARWLATEADVLLRSGRVIEAAQGYELAATRSAEHGGDERTILDWRLTASAARSSAGHIDEAVETAWRAVPLARRLGAREFARTAVLTAGPWFRHGEQQSRAEQMLRDALTQLPPEDAPSRVAVFEALLRMLHLSQTPQTETFIEDATDELAAVAASAHTADVRALAVTGLTHAASRKPEGRQFRWQLSAQLVRLTAGLGGERHLAALDLHLRSLLDGGPAEALPATLATYRLLAEREGATRHQWWAAMAGRALAAVVGDEDAVERLGAEAESLSLAVDGDTVAQVDLEWSLAQLIRGRPAPALDRLVVDGHEATGAPLITLISYAAGSLRGESCPQDIATGWRASCLGHRSVFATLMLTIALRTMRDELLRADLAGEGLPFLLPTTAGLATGTGCGIFGANAHFAADLLRMGGRDAEAAAVQYVGDDVIDRYTTAIRKESRYALQ